MASHHNGRVALAERVTWGRDELKSIDVSVRGKMAIAANTVQPHASGERRASSPGLFATADLVPVTTDQRWQECPPAGEGVPPRHFDAVLLCAEGAFHHHLRDRSSTAAKLVI